MIKFSFRRGIRFFEGLRVWTVIKRLPNGRIQLEDANTEVTNLSIAEIREKYVKGDFVVDAESLNDDGTSCHMVVPRDLSTFPEQEQKAAVRRQQYVTSLLKEGSIKMRSSELQERVAKLAEELGDKNPPSCSSIYRWHRRFKHGKSIVSLVARNENKGRRSSWTKEVMDIVDRAIEEAYLNIQKNPRKAVIERVQKLIGDLNKSAARLQKIVIPSPAGIYRYLTNLHRYTVDTARAGKDLQMTKYRSVVGTVKVKRINERWEIDHTPIDMMVFCEKSMLPMGKPWLTAIIDRYSRMIVGFYISFQSPSADSVLQAVVHAILPKEDFLKRYPDIKADWPACGLSEEIVCDNGMDFHSESFRQACFELNMNLTFCAAKTPQQKGAIERLLRTVNYDLIHRLPGTVFGNAQQREDYESEAEASIGFATLTHIVTKWIVDIYHHTPHRSLRNTPYNVWNKGASETVIEYPASPEQLKIVASKIETRTLFHYGVELSGLKYNNVALQDIRRQFGDKDRSELTIKYLESDVGYIYVFHPTEKEYLRVNAVHSEYANGLHRAQHRLIQKRLRANQIDATDIDRLLEAKHELQELVRQAVHSKKMRHRKKSAELRGLNSNAPALNTTPNSLVVSVKEAVAPVLEGDDDDLPLPSFEVARNVLGRPEGELNDK